MTGKIHKTKFYSWKMNELPQGCRQCVKGEKLVMFVTGACPRKCAYCPLSEQKKDRDVIFANERQLEDENQIQAIIEEAKACRSRGAGFTGGDPLARIDRSCRYIRALKEEFGKEFHIHLYTSIDLLNDANLRKLEEAGLDELRFHPDLSNPRQWNKAEIFKKKYNFALGIEMPVLPAAFEQTKSIIDFFIDKVDFINLNELEISDADSFVMKDVRTRNMTYYGAQGSQEIAMQILGYINEKYPTTNVHYCTCKLKDKIQLAGRLKRRAKNTARKFDIVTDEGTIVLGAIYLEKTAPKFSYKENLRMMRTSALEKELSTARNFIVDKYSIPEDLIEIDERKMRLVTNIGIVQQLSKHLKSKRLIPAIVEQYPTYDQMEVEVEFL